ncbi:response regulator [Phaeovulum vinaykumarii]|uniref:Response regulatory domain-containing protein n=1 Tax=Phaeovulum vinaykumarii TaxID=407234 RepID=A0A1N7LIK4_9RHOB|nr:response regulator [Phaeovulum vinaykumarii]SIS73629.1 hypothetical protein SAMN05421795_10389 [Phaeovulum vinaykumarii]SOC04730.1 hypothetical protein SAMN05878426_10389 [Phaeovulum vinaykumarii]
MTNAPPPGSKPVSDPTSGPQQRRILVVEPNQSLPAALRGVSGVAVTISRWHALDAELLAQVNPDVVMCPLFMPGHDVIDLARRLHDMGYRGALRAFCSSVPDPDLIRREVAHACPEVSFELIVLNLN